MDVYVCSANIPVMLWNEMWRGEKRPKIKEIMSVNKEIYLKYINVPDKVEDL